ncbi:MAG: zinc ribbon domain-containing protein [Atopobiaceae bacterium]|nr:zinc ribbon domain-containing protein [Atopobiaceae bacterium]
MICPYCETHIKDGSLICPACHADVSTTSSMPLLELNYCHACGALIPEDAVVCPKCQTPHEDSLLAAQGVQRESQQSELPESVIPSQEEIADAYADEQPPKIGAYLMACVVAIALVGGFFWWSADKFGSIQRTGTDSAADVSMAGFPGLIEALTGQDRKAVAEKEQQNAVPENLYSRLLASWQQLGEYAQRIDEVEKRAQEHAVSGSLAERQAALAESEALALELSNFIQTLSSFDGSDPDYDRYTDNIFQLQTLGNYLRNQLDALRQLWDASVAFGENPPDEAVVFGPVAAQRDAQTGKDVYRIHFEDNYEVWKPQE